MGQYEYQKYAQEFLIESGYNFNAFYDNKQVDVKVFERLVNLLYNNNNLAISASMLIEGSLLKLTYQPPFYHVALETIAYAMRGGVKKTLNPPLSNKEYKKKVRPFLLKALKDIKELTDDVKRIYTKRITDNLNDAPNRDKLLNPFDNTGYTLTDSDKDAMDKRNYTLHGHLSDIKKELPEQQSDMFAVALRLHKLCCILLLKAAGYTGRILNNEVIFGVKEACERKESPYIYI